MGLEAGIWASRLGFELGRGGTDGGGEEGGEISPMCESIGHRPLLGRCPKGKEEEEEEEAEEEEEEKG